MKQELSLIKPIRAFFLIQTEQCLYFLNPQFLLFFIQFNVPFRIISAMRRAKQVKNFPTHPQAELGLSHMRSVWGWNLLQTQR